MGGGGNDRIQRRPFNTLFSSSLSSTDLPCPSPIASCPSITHRPPFPLYVLIRRYYWSARRLEQNGAEGGGEHGTFPFPRTIPGAPEKKPTSKASRSSDWPERVCSQKEKWVPLSAPLCPPSFVFLTVGPGYSKAINPPVCMRRERVSWPLPFSPSPRTFRDILCHV